MPPTSDAASELSKSSIYALSSLYEGFGLVLVEAMSCGVPCVAMSCECGPSEIINDGVDGILVPAGDIAGLADGICRLIEDEPLRHSMGAAARRSVEQRFTTEVIMRQWDGLFRELER